MVHADMTEDEKQIAGLQAIYLSACALQGIKPVEERVKEMNFRHVYEVAEYHKITAVVYMALEMSENFLACADAELLKAWKDKKEKVIRKNMLFDAEREQILLFMEQNGIWYLPLKGIILKDMYPQIGMRQMADNDILFDPAYQKKLMDYMLQRGYKAESIGKMNHDVYQKPPFYNFEMHTSLVGKMYSRIWQQYYENIKDKLKKDKNKSFGYHFTDEDFYIFFIVHAFKHYDNAGNGFRFLMDCYVYCQKKERSMDWEYIKQELHKLELADFEEQSGTLAKKLFSNPEQVYEIELTDKEKNMWGFLLQSGTYGTQKNRIEKTLKKMNVDQNSAAAKLKYIFRRFIPDSEWLQSYAPFCYRHKWSIPFYLVFRSVRGIIRKRKKLMNEFSTVIKFKKED